MDFRETRSWRPLGWGTFDEMKLQGVFRWTRLLVSVVCTFWNLTTTVVEGRGTDRRPGRILFWRGTVSRRSSIAFPSDSVVLLTRVRINGKHQQNALIEPPPKKRKNTSKGKARVSPVKDQLRTVMKLTWMFLLWVQLRQHLIYTTTVMVLITTLHCHCVDKLLDELEKLDLDWKKECQANAVLQQELEKEKKRVDFCLDRFKDDDSKIRFYTGFTTFGMLMACYTFLLPSAKIMRTWQGN